MKLTFNKDLKNVNMKRMFRRNQIIVTTLAVMIAAAGYLNYTAEQELSGDGAYEAGLTDISDADILEENQRVLDARGGYEELWSLDQDRNQIEEAESLASAEGETIASDAGMEAGALAGNGETEAAGQQYAMAENSSGEASRQEEAGAEAGMENPGEAILTSGLSVSDYIAGVQLSREQVRAKNKDTLLAIINNANIEEEAKQQAIRDMIELTDLSERENAAESLLLAKGFSDPMVSITSGQVDVVVNAPSITDAQRAQIEDVVKRKTEVSAENIIITLLNLED